jgi:general secretion pathway protein F
MTLFRYKAITGAGEVVEGELNAADQRDAVNQLHEMGYTPVRADRARAEQTARRRRNILTMELTSGRASQVKRAVLFVQDLATLLTAGVALDRALELSGEFSDDDGMAAMLERVLDSVREGKSLADSIAEYGEGFPRYAVGLIRAGEAGGTLARTLNELALSMEREQALKDRVITSLYYPIIVLIAAGVALGVLMTAVVPEFAPLFEDAGKPPPWSIAAILDVNRFLADYWWAVLAAIALLIFMLRTYFRQPDGRRQWHGIVLALPFFGEFFGKVEMARIGRTLGTLLANGVALLPALAVVRDVTNNLILGQALDQAGESLRQGKGLAEPLAQSGYFPAMAIQLIRIGEEAGQLDAMLVRIANIYDREVERSTQRFLAALVPAVTIVMGLAIMGIMLPLLSALFSVYDLPV